MGTLFYTMFSFILERVLLRNNIPILPISRIFDTNG
nr:MAG TPA: hypothetical protein [Caudoviricetes sp.]